MGIDLENKETIAIIGHEPTLSRLLTRFTGKRARSFATAEIVCIEAAGMRELDEGRAKLDFRLPVADHQEEALRKKVESKMNVAGLLAGFSFAALMALLLNVQFEDAAHTWTASQLLPWVA